LKFLKCYLSDVSVNSVVYAYHISSLDFFLQQVVVISSYYFILNKKVRDRGTSDGKNIVVSLCCLLWSVLFTFSWWSKEPEQPVRMIPP